MKGTPYTGATFILPPKRLGFMQDNLRGYNQCSWNIFYRTHARKNIFLRNAVRRKNMTVATPGGERGIEWQIKGRDFFIMNLRKCLWWWRLCSSRRRFLIVDLCCQWYACMCEPFGKHHNASFLGGKSSRDLNYDLPKHSKNPNCKHTIISKQIGHWFLVKMHRFRIHTLKIVILILSPCLVKAELKSHT